MGSGGEATGVIDGGSAVVVVVTVVQPKRTAGTMVRAAAANILGLTIESVTVRILTVSSRSERSPPSD